MSTHRILMLLPFLVKGALSIGIARSLRARGMAITIAYCVDASLVYTPDPLADFEATGDLIHLTGMAGPKRLQIIEELLVERKINLIVQIGAAELYHLLPYWKERLPHLRIVDTLYNEFGHTLNHFLYEACIDGVIVESQFMREYVQCSTLKKDQRIHVLHNGVDLEEFTPNERPTGPRMKIGYVGRMSHEKNPLGFVELAEKLGRMNPSLEFAMFGSGPDAAFIAKRVAESDMAHRLTSHGFIDPPKDALRQLDVLIVPSRFDGRPAIVMEANACGIPVIAAPVGGIPEQIVDGVNGFLIPSGDVERIHTLLVQWQQEPAVFQALKRSARDHALAHFGSDRMIERYASTFADLATGCPPAPVGAASAGRHGPCPAKQRVEESFRHAAEIVATRLQKHEGAD